MGRELSDAKVGMGRVTIFWEGSDNGWARKIMLVTA